VKIQDRGPYVKGRIVDLSPATADKIGITPKEGLATVEVAPVALPPPEDDGARGPASTAPAGTGGKAAPAGTAGTAPPQRSP
jgi:rare lipoprotein A (peptidoglycan hydrolase)